MTDPSNKFNQVETLLINSRRNCGRFLPTIFSVTEEAVSEAESIVSASEKPAFATNTIVPMTNITLLVAMTRVTKAKKFVFETDTMVSIPNTLVFAAFTLAFANETSGMTAPRKKASRIPVCCFLNYCRLTSWLSRKIHSQILRSIFPQMRKKALEFSHTVCSTSSEDSFRKVLR
jgi:hypothetical protein